MKLTHLIVFALCVTIAKAEEAKEPKEIKVSGEARVVKDTKIARQPKVAKVPKLKGFIRKIDANKETKMVQETKMSNETDTPKETKMSPETEMIRDTKMRPEMEMTADTKMGFQTEMVKDVKQSIDVNAATNAQQNPQPISKIRKIVKINEMNELKMKLTEPLNSLRNEYPELRGSKNFYLNLIRDATIEQEGSGILYTIRALLGIPPINCDLKLFESDGEYTLHSKCAGYRFNGGIKPVNGQRVKREADGELSAIGPNDFPTVITLIQNVLLQLKTEQGAQLELRDINNAQTQIMPDTITRWVIKADLAMSMAPQFECDLDILDQPWSGFRDGTIQCDQSTYRIATGERHKQI